MSNLATVLESDHIHGDGRFTKSATAALKAITGSTHALLTTSCTHALELGALLLELGPGDEVIVPSFAFSSAATAVALRGATVVFVDIDPSTGNIDPACVAAFEHGGRAVGTGIASVVALLDVDVEIRERQQPRGGLEHELREVRRAVAAA